MRRNEEVIITIDASAVTGKALLLACDKVEHEYGDRITLTPLIPARHGKFELVAEDDLEISIENVRERLLQTLKGGDKCSLAFCSAPVYREGHCRVHFLTFISDHYPDEPNYLHP